MDFTPVLHHLAWWPVSPLELLLPALFFHPAFLLLESVVLFDKALMPSD